MRDWNWKGASLAFLVGLAVCGLGTKLAGPVVGILLFFASIALVFKLTEPKVVYVQQPDDEEED
jgi:hypothetical protein